MEQNKSMFSASWLIMAKALSGMKSASIKATVRAFIAETNRLASVNPSPALFNRAWAYLEGVAGTAKYPEYIKDVLKLSYDKKTKTFAGKMRGIKWEDVPSFADWMQSQKTVQSDFQKIMKILDSDKFSATPDELAQLISILQMK